MPNVAYCSFAPNGPACEEGRAHQAGEVRRAALHRGQQQSGERFSGLEMAVEEQREWRGTGDPKGGIDMVAVPPAPGLRTTPATMPTVQRRLNRRNSVAVIGVGRHR